MTYGDMDPTSDDGPKRLLPDAQGVFGVVCEKLGT